MMTIELNHIIIPAHDKHASAKYLADILGVPAGYRTRSCPSP
jgi:hypothetical protein